MDLETHRIVIRGKILQFTRVNTKLEKEPQIEKVYPEISADYVGKVKGCLPCLQNEIADSCANGQRQIVLSQ